ncbi:MAG TPA: SDR family oxidoreductase [Fluviicola sp.]|nr:SDR family oxidoreductase [Fluviicola sp.]
MSKTILVVGASRGIGLETVKRFAADAANTIIAFARSFDENHILAEYSNVQLHSLDLSLPNVNEQLQPVIDQLDRIDILINNAGYIVVKPFTELSHAEIQMAYQVNVIGVMQTIQTCFPKLKKGTHIVNISSMGGFQGSMKFAGLSAYSTSKAAVVSLTELLAEEFKETGIKINCLCLGAVQTEMLETAFPGYKAPLLPEEMADYICDFAIHASRFMQGKIIPVSLTTP